MTPTPQLRIPPPGGPVSRHPDRLKTIPVDWTQSPWQPDQPARSWKYIVLHHTATKAGSVESIHRTHLARKDADGNPWRGIGYHFVIGNGQGMPDGQVEATFRWRDQIDGAHAGVAKYNRWGIGICLIGDFEHQPPTDAQLRAVTDLVTVLADRFDLGPEAVKRHGELKATSCPGRLFPMQELTRALTSHSAAALRKQ